MSTRSFISSHPQNRIHTKQDAPVIGTISNVSKRYLRGIGVRSRPRSASAEYIRLPTGGYVATTVVQTPQHHARITASSLCTCLSYCNYVQHKTIVNTCSDFVYIRQHVHHRFHTYTLNASMRRHARGCGRFGASDRLHSRRRGILFRENSPNQPERNRLGDRICARKILNTGQFVSADSRQSCTDNA